MTTARRPASGRLIAALLVGAAVAVGLGVYGNLHDPTGRSLVTLVFTGSINLKVWFATVAFLLAMFQLGSALRIYGKVGAGRAPKWLGKVHRASGTLAFFLTVPVAYHCLWALGFQAGEPRVLAHGLFGCLFFGALAAKVLVVRSRRLPAWALPIAGSVVFTALTAIWLTSAFWFFTNRGFPAF